VSGTLSRTPMLFLGHGPNKRRQYRGKSESVGVDFKKGEIVFWRIASMGSNGGLYEELGYVQKRKPAPE